MAVWCRCLCTLLFVALLCTGSTACGGRQDSGDSSWRQEVDASLSSWEDASSFRYRVHLETWIGVSGQSVYGDEKGEGSYLDGQFSVSFVRTSPAGEENIVFTSQAGGYFLQEGGSWKSITALEVPSPLYDPRALSALVSSYGSITLEGEEEVSGAVCRRYLLQLGQEKASEALSDRAWSYFSSLDYELNCRVWVSDPAAPPCSISLEVIGFDPQESLQRYRLVATMGPYDLDAPGILLAAPGQEQ